MPRPPLTETQTPTNLWRWNGTGRNRPRPSLFHHVQRNVKASAVCRDQNVILQHLFSDLGMVGGHQLAASVGVLERRKEICRATLREITNLQMGTGIPCSITHYWSLRPGKIAPAAPQCKWKEAPRNFFSDANAFRRIARPSLFARSRPLSTRACDLTGLSVFLKAWREQRQDSMKHPMVRPGV
ncbi:MAG: hypothetical protein U1F57_11820 [bacterium]